MRTSGVLFALACLVCGSPSPAAGEQESTPVLRATLRGWEDDSRLAIFDRDGAFDGRLSDRGILQRFSVEQDNEYTLDLVSTAFPLIEEYDWYSRRSGARWWAGSINHRFLVQRAEVAGRVELGETSSFGVLFSQESTLEADRALVRVDFRKGYSGRRVTPFVAGYLNADKPEMDIEVGSVFRSGRNEITVAVAALDLFSDLIFQNLGVNARFSEHALDFDRLPMAFRAALDLALADDVRGELYGLYLTPTTVGVTGLADTASSFAQDERYAYTGGLVEWTPSSTMTVGTVATLVRARTDRTPTDSIGANDYDLREGDARLGLYALHRPAAWLLVEGRVARVWRTESRARPASSGIPGVDYEDRSWEGRVGAAYRLSRTFGGEVGFDFVLRRVIRGEGSLPIRNPGVHHTRLRLDFGWRFGETALFGFGTNVDLDRDRGGATGLFDGGHARFQIFW